VSTEAVDRKNYRESDREPRQGATELLLALARWVRRLLARALHGIAAHHKTTLNR
jgi:transposase